MPTKGDHVRARQADAGRPRGEASGGPSAAGRPWAAAPELSPGACRSCRRASEASTSTAVRPRPGQRHIWGIRRVACFASVRVEA